MISSTASQNTLVLPAHTGQHIHAQSESDTALLSAAVPLAGLQCPAAAGQASSCLLWNTAQCTQANTLHTTSWYIKGKNLMFWNPIPGSQIESFSKWLEESEVSKCLLFAPVYSIEVTTSDRRRNSILHCWKISITTLARIKSSTLVKRCY